MAADSSACRFSRWQCAAVSLSSVSLFHVSGLTGLSYQDQSCCKQLRKLEVQLKIAGQGGLQRVRRRWGCCLSLNVVSGGDRWPGEGHQPC